MGGRYWTRPGKVRHAFAATHEGGADLPANGKPQSCAALLGHSKIESTVRYLGIKVDDAIEIAERIDI